jgi:hypothetical protein
MAAEFFSKGFLEQLVLQAQVCLGPLQPTVLDLDRLHMPGQRRIHPAILRPPLVERRVAHPVLAAQIGHRHTALGRSQDRDDLRFSVSACLHSESPRSSCRENSTYAAPYFRGGLPWHPEWNFTCSHKQESRRQLDRTSEIA